VTFTSEAIDQFGAAISGVSGVAWSATGEGTIDASGKFTAGSQAGSADVVATLGTLTASTQVTVSSSNPSETQGGCASTGAGEPLIYLGLAALALLRPRAIRA
jgi:hypothetical protein